MPQYGGFQFKIDKKLTVEDFIDEIFTNFHCIMMYNESVIFHLKGGKKIKVDVIELDEVIMGKNILWIKLIGEVNEIVIPHDSILYMELTPYNPLTSGLA